MLCISWHLPRRVIVFSCTLNIQKTKQKQNKWCFALAPFEELQTCCTFGLKMVVLQKQYLVRLRWLWQLRQKGAAGQTNQAKILKKTTVIIEQVSLSNNTAAPPIFRCKFNLWHTKFWKRNFLSTCKMISFAHGVLSP